MSTWWPLALLLSVVASPARAEPYVGTQHVLVLLVNEGELGFSDDFFRQRAAEDLATLSAAYREYSWNAVSFDFRTLGPIHVTSDGCVTTGDNRFHDNEMVLLRKAVAAVDPQVDFSTVHQIILLHVESTACSAGGSGLSRRVWDLATAEGPLDSSVAFSWENNSPQATVIAHELGHTIGGSHTEPLVCYDQPGDLTTRVPIRHSYVPNGCVLAPPWYLMQDVQCVGANLHHFSINAKALFGWVAPSQIITATRGLYTIGPTEPLDVGVRALRIPLTNSQWKYYYLELRAPTGLDADQTPGVYLYAVNDGPQSTWQQLIEYPLSSETEFSARPLLGGQVATCVPTPSYVDAAQNLAIYVTAVSPTSATIVLAAPPGPPNPDFCVPDPVVSE